MEATESLKSLVQTRAATEKDVPFIFNSWLKSFRASTKALSPVLYYEWHHKVIEALLRRSEVLVACSINDANQIYGYAVLEKREDVPILHYCYTKEAFRKTGIQGMLLAKLKLPPAYFYSHSTKSFAEQIKKDSTQAVYNPYLQSPPPEGDK